VVDATSRALQGDADEWVDLPRDLAQAREALARATLDVVLYPDIGMDPFTYFLAFARLAPVQCTTWGHPVTTGISAMDYFVSTDYFEPEHAESHYSERLIRLKDVTFPGYYERPAMPPPAPPAALGFDRGRRVYFCPHALFKFHPDVDPVFAEILRRDPGGEIVIAHDNERDAFRLARLQARLRRTAGDVCERIVFVPHMPSRDGYLQRLQACEVILDTIHYGGGNTSLEAISAGALVVTLPSQFNRGRHTYGFFRKMRFVETVVQTPAEYVDLAVRIATDRELRTKLKSEQAIHAHRLYEDQGAVDQIEAFFEQALATAGRN
jgi:predicted O-linked N-acetylglucosamine transferase (SPINDLY family)